jgi:hypothetical protein
MMFLIGRLVGRTTSQVMTAITSTEECRASEISASEPIAMPTANFAAAMPALAKIDIAATLVLRVGLRLMGGGLAGGCARLKVMGKGATANHLQQRFVANYSNLRGRHCGRSEAIHLSACEVTMDCFAALAMTWI